MKKTTIPFLIYLLLFITFFSACSKKQSVKQSFTLKVSAIQAGVPLKGGSFVRAISATSNSLIKLDANDSADFAFGRWEFQVVSYEGPLAQQGKQYCGSLTEFIVDSTLKNAELTLNEANCLSASFVNLIADIDSQFGSKVFSLSNVQIINNQIILSGVNLANVNQLDMKIGGVTSPLQIESQSSSSLIANTMSNVTIVAGTVMDLILSNANATSSFTINMDLSTNGATVGQVLKFNGTTWVPMSLPSSQAYIGTWDAITNTPDLSTVTPQVGDYFIVSTAGVYNAVTFEVGDWAMYNGTTFDKVSTNLNTKLSLTGGTLSGDLIVNTQMILKGGSNFITLKANPALASNLTLMFPLTSGTAGQFLSTDGSGTLNWVTPAAGGVTSVNSLTGVVNLTSTEITEGTNLYFTNARSIASTISAPTLTNAPIATSDSVQTAFGKLQAQINNIISITLAGLSTATNSALIASDSILSAFGKLQAQITSLAATKLDKTGGTLSVGTINGVTTPVNADEIVNKGYVDSFGQWTISGGNIYRASGNVGIGITNPTKMLEVAGDILVNGLSIGRGSVASNLFFGPGAFNNTATGYQNIAIGNTALQANSTGVNNTVVGYSVMVGNTTGSDNTVMGYAGMNYASNGSGNSAFGSTALYNNSTGSSNSALGSYSLNSNNGKNESTAIGFNSMRFADNTATTSVSYNTALGAYALRGSTTAANNTGVENTAIGHSTLQLNTSGSSNNALGSQALRSNTTGTMNNGFGGFALAGNTTGSYNLGMGYGALSANTAGFYNSSVGDHALTANTTGTGNSAIGSQALTTNATGYYNSALGYFALKLTTGSNNIGVGYNAGSAITTGSNNVYIGSFTGAGSETLSNHIIFSDGSGVERIRVTNTGNMGIGTTTPSYKLDVQGGDINASGSVRAATVALSSDRRWKRNISPLKNSIKKITQINGVSYDWAIDDYPEKHFTDRKQIGVIAQDVQAVFPELVLEDKQGFLSVNYPALIAPLIEAIKEQELQISANLQMFKTMQGEFEELKLMAKDNKRELASVKTKVEKLEIESANKSKEILDLKKENTLIKSYLCSRDNNAIFCK